MKHSSPDIVRPKQHTALPHPSAPADAEAPSLPVESIIVAPKKIQDPTPNAPRAPYQILKWADDRPSTRHWGINE